MSDELNLENLDAALENVDAAADEAPVADAPAEAVEPAEPVAEAPVASPETVTESAEEESEVNESEQAEETDAGQKAVDEFSKSLRTLDGKWYVLHTYSGYEKRVKTNIESRVALSAWKIRSSRSRCRWKRSRSTPKKARRSSPACVFLATC